MNEHRFDSERLPERQAMFDSQLCTRDIVDRRVLSAMLRVPRHRFVPPSLAPYAYLDRALPISHDATISQPYIVALMLQLAEIDEGDRVLEIGTGSGYQAAVLAELGAEVHTIELVDELATEAAERLASLGYRNIQVHSGDGYYGCPGRAPFAAIIGSAAPPHVPPPLLEQLEPCGRLVVPIGRRFTTQALTVLTRTDSGVSERIVTPVAFIPMTWPRREQEKRHV